MKVICHCGKELKIMSNFTPVSTGVHTVTVGLHDCISFTDSRPTPTEPDLVEAGRLLKPCPICSSDFNPVYVCVHPQSG